MKLSRFVDHINRLSIWISRNVDKKMASTETVFSPGSTAIPASQVELSVQGR